MLKIQEEFVFNLFTEVYHTAKISDCFQIKAKISEILDSVKLKAISVKQGAMSKESFKLQLSRKINALIVVFEGSELTAELQKDEHYIKIMDLIA